MKNAVNDYVIQTSGSTEHCMTCLISLRALILVTWQLIFALFTTTVQNLIHL